MSGDRDSGRFPNSGFHLGTRERRACLAAAGRRFCGRHRGRAAKRGGMRGERPGGGRQGLEKKTAHSRENANGPRTILHRNAVRGAFENPQFKWEPEIHWTSPRDQTLAPDGLSVGSPKGTPLREHGRDGIRSRPRTAHIRHLQCKSCRGGDQVVSGEIADEPWSYACRSRWIWSRSRAASSYCSRATASASWSSSRSMGPSGRERSTSARQRFRKASSGHDAADSVRSIVAEEGLDRRHTLVDAAQGGAMVALVEGHLGAGPAVDHRHVGPVLIELELVLVARRVAHHEPEEPEVARRVAHHHVVALQVEQREVAMVVLEPFPEQRRAGGRIEHVGQRARLAARSS